MFEAKAELEYHNSWVIAKCHQDTLEYYRWWVWKKTNIWVNKPRWGAHISVIRGKEEINPVDFVFEKTRNNPIVKYKYSNNIEFRNDGYVWLPIISEDIKDVREECGLPRDPIMPFHMTIGSHEQIKKVAKKYEIIRLTRNET